MDIARISRGKRIATLTVASVQVGLVSGIIFGWPALQEIFARQGIYADLCSPGEPSPCSEQFLRFNLIYTVATFVNTASPILNGAFLDRFGPKLTNIVGSSIFLLGCLLFALPTIHNVDIYPYAFALLGFGGPTIQVSLFNVSLLWSGHEKNVLSAFSALFALSSLVFRIFEWITRGGLSLGYMFVFFALFLMPLFAVGYILLPLKSYETRKPITDTTTNKIASDDDATPLVVHPSFKDNDVQAHKKKNKYCFSLINSELLEELKLQDYWLVTAFMSIQALHTLTYLADVSKMFQDHPSYVNGFTWIWSFGVLFMPLIGRIHYQ
eukprot:TRINITY_DN6311_c0_g1_i3.p1 TRINITY_DN6311_c0_g1~~TRINITY_DN6311_c0_g1_i3.p1  ORF type:complete len:324 (+),score=41.58 TRINITY_DN6311_c0_g1_i3:65-1036(+)